MAVWTNPAVNGVPNPGPQVIYTSSTPIGIAPSGTMGANGAVTVPALPFTYSAANCNGIWWYFPAGAVYAGSLAGIYWTVMSSTTLGQVYDSKYVSGPTTPPVSPVVKTDAGPGAYAAPSTEITLLSVTIPGGSMGPNGKLRKSFSLNATNSANTKTFFERFNGTTSGIGQVLTTSPSYNIISEFRNRGVVGGNMSSSNSGMAGPSSTSTVTVINTAADMTYTLTGTLTAAGSLAGEFMAYEHLCIELFSG